MKNIRVKRRNEIINSSEQGALEKKKNSSYLANTKQNSQLQNLATKLKNHYKPHHLESQK